MGTDAEVSRYYLLEDAEKKDNGHIQGWMKTIANDGISSKRMYQWDCVSERMRMLSITIYYPDNSMVYTDEKIRDWKMIVLDTVGDRMLDKLCNRKKDIYFAEIILTKANMRNYPGSKNEILRIANKGEKFRVVSSLKDNSWYNVVE